MSAKKAVEGQDEPKKAADAPKKGSFSNWLGSILEPLVVVAVDRAISDLHTEIKNDLVDMENKLLGQFTQLPGMVASQVEHVALDAEQVAEKVAGRFGNFLNPQGMAEDVANRTGGLVNNLLNPGAIAQEVINRLPHFPGFG